MVAPTKNRVNGDGWCPLHCSDVTNRLHPGPLLDIPKLRGMSAYHMFVTVEQVSMHVNWFLGSHAVNMLEHQMGANQMWRFYNEKKGKTLMCLTAGHVSGYLCHFRWQMSRVAMGDFLFWGPVIYWVDLHCGPVIICIQAGYPCIRFLKQHAWALEPSKALLHCSIEHHISTEHHSSTEHQTTTALLHSVALAKDNMTYVSWLGWIHLHF